MAQDDFKAKGQAKSTKPDAGGGVIRSVPVLGIVKNNIDATRAGRVDVYIADFGSPDPENKSSWITVSYMSPFFGSTRAQGGKKDDDYGTYTQNPSSYGMWFSPPDIGSTVVCIFINGDTNYGYYIGSILPPELLQMIPAIGTSDGDVILNEGEANSLGGSTKLPVTNLNTNNSKATNSASFLSQPKPVHSYSASIYSQQGLIRDPLRGPITSSALRESPSRVGWGVSTPGRPIFQGGYTDENVITKGTKGSNTSLQVVSRRGGHSIVMDDGNVLGKDQLIRLRTALGHQILMSDDGQCLHIIHSNGQSWIELGKEGTIDMYATNSVNIRTQGDLNLHADNNININAKKDLNISADNINLNTENDVSFRTGGNFSGYILGKYTIKVNGAMSMGSSGTGSYASADIMYVNGKKVNLNSGSTSTVPAEVPLITQIAHTDTLFDATKGYAAAPGKLLSIVSRAPAHAPWANANQGVDVQVTNNASTELPAAPSKSAAAATSASASTTPTPVTPAVASTVPATKATSPSLNKGVTSAMVSSVATNAATAAPGVVATGAGVIADAKGQLTAAVGSLAQTPQQLEAAGIIKPGASTLINGLVQGGSNVSAAMTNNLFTGKPGAENLTALSNNVNAQVTAQVANFQQAQSALTKTGVITGAESPSQIAGMVTSVSQVGLPATVDFVKNAVASVPSAPGVSGAVGGAVSKAMSSGTFAADLGTKVSGGLGSVSTSLSGASPSDAAGKASLISSVKGVTGAAFTAITAAFKSFKPGIPQNLKAIAKQNTDDQAKAEQAAAAPTETAKTAAAVAATPSLKEALAAAPGAISAATSALGSNFPSIPGAPTGSLSALSAGGASTATAVSGLFGQLGSSVPGASSIASGLNKLPGGAGVASSIVGGGGASTVPGLEGVTALTKNASTAALNGIPTSVAGASSLAGLSAGNLGAAVNGATTSLDTAALTKGLTEGKQGLAALTSAGLPAASAAQLTANINSLNTGGPSPIKLPTIAENTINRGEVTTQLNSLLGNSKIPAPNFSGNLSLPSKQLSQAEIDQYDKIKAELTILRDKRFDYQKDLGNARYALSKAQQNLPQGDPAIASAESTLATAKKTLEDLDAKIVTLQERQYTLVTGKPPAATPPQLSA